MSFKGFIKYTPEKTGLYKDLIRSMLCYTIYIFAKYARKKEKKKL